MNQTKIDALSKAQTRKMTPYATEEKIGGKTLHDDPKTKRNND